MAVPKDYVGLSFGDFLIEKSIAHGAEAEVYQCVHRSTGIRYVLRLDVNDDATWDGPPLNPPRNASLETANARGSWMASGSYYQHTLQRLKSGETEWKMVVPAVYGVADGRYLVPVASPIRVKGAWDIDRVLRTGPADDVYLFEMWEDVVLAMIGGAYSEYPASREWETKWARLLGGPILTRAMTQYLRGGSLTETERQTVLKNIAERREAGPEFAENILLRLCGCISRRRISLQEARATLSCRHFRINISAADLNQMIAAYSAIADSPLALPEDSIALMNFVFEELKKAPLDPYDNCQDFELRQEQPDVAQFPLFLQEFAGASQDVLMLEAS